MIVPGPTNESGQRVTFNLLSDSNPALFSSPPTVDPSGTLAYTPAAGVSGTATITLDLQDDGGTANGGHDTSAPQAFMITVAPPVPLAAADTDVLSLGTSSSAGPTDGVLANDVSQDGQPSVLHAAIVSSPTHGTLVFHADGSFSYTPGPGFDGLDRFTYQATEGTSTGSQANVTLLSYPASIVAKLYNQVLGRSPDDQGLQFWTSQVQPGGPHAGDYGMVAEGIFESDERLNVIIGGGQLGSITYPGYYPQFLLRQADAAGLAYWKGIWKQGGGPDQVIAGMIGSPEFYASAGKQHADLSPDAAWVTALYERLLNREPDADGLRYWTSSLGSGAMSRTQVVLGFVDSDENFRNLTTTFFEEYLLRQPTAGELDQYVGQFRLGASQRTIQLAIVNLPEYTNSPPAPVAGRVGPVL
jgi:hypothetical protein